MSNLFRLVSTAEGGGSGEYFEPQINVDSTPDVPISEPEPVTEPTTEPEPTSGNQDLPEGWNTPQVYPQSLNGDMLTTEGDETGIPKSTASVEQPINTEDGTCVGDDNKQILIQILIGVLIGMLATRLT